MRTPSGRLVCDLWLLTVVAFAGIWVAYHAMYGRNVGWSVFWFFLGGWWLGAVPFAVAAFVVSIIRVKRAAPPEGTTPRENRGCLRDCLWVFAILLVLVLLTFLVMVFGSIFRSGGGGFWKD